MNVPFVIATNGYQFVLYDRITGITTKPRPIAEIPTPIELRGAYESGMGFSLESQNAKPLLVKYQGGEATRRYYQDAGIRAVLEHITKGEKRALLSLATGAGKTFIAVHLLKRIADAGWWAGEGIMKVFIIIAHAVTLLGLPLEANYATSRLSKASLLNMLHGITSWA